jgi:hypothetical protein
MQELTGLLGFDGRFIVYPIGALIVAAALKVIIHRYMRRWVERTKSEIDDKILNYIESLIIPVLLLSVLHFISAWLPLPTDKIGYIRKGIIVTAILLITFYSARLLSGILATLETSRESWQRFTQALA